MEKGSNSPICVSRRSNVSEKPQSAESLLRQLDFENYNYVMVSSHICITIAINSNIMPATLCGKKGIKCPLHRIKGY